MYFDDSHTEVKVTDVTHCDLETKSILKPPKARAPLQEVDLGNHITVEFDVIRKRRVSFAGVNKIKEFNSEAKSFSICSTPAYEEKVSTSSDSSAFSTSVSGNINSLTKENDITILDDTMDLTDLSIVQVSAMDITGIKPQKPLQGVPDIFAPRSQDSGLFSNQGINRPIFSCEINNPTVDNGLEPNPLQTKSEKSNTPEDTPLVLDPRKMLLNELLEESAVDCSVDNYLKANILFAQNACNAIESKFEIKKSLLDVSEMDFTQALAEPIKPASHHVQPVLEKKNLASEPIHAKVISNNPSNLFGSLGMDMEQSSRLQGNVLEMEYSKPSQKPRKSNMFPNFNNDENKSMKMDASQMEFTEALPPKNFNQVQNSLVASNYIKDRLLTMPNSSYMEQLNLIQNMNKDNVNFNYMELRLGNTSTSQMEFTEALPYKFKNLVARNCSEDIKPTEHTTSSQNNMSPNLNVNEPRIAKNSYVSQMEFTEALPSKSMIPQTLITDVHRTDSLSPIEQIKPFQKSIPNFNVDESRTGTTNVSQMEFTEALPSKNIMHQHLVANNPKHFLNPIVPNISVDESRRGNANISQMEFTEVLPSKKIGCQALVPNIHNTASDHTKPFQKSTPSHVTSNFNIDESRTGKHNNASQMEFTEALPSKSLAPYNFNINEFGLEKSNNETQMELTEAIPSQKVNLVVNNVVTINYIGERLLNRPNNSNLMPDRQFHDNNMFLNSNVEKSRSLETNNVPEIKSIGAQTSPDVEKPFTTAANNMLISSNVSQKVQPNPRKSILSETNNTSQMEFTEALPSKKLPDNDIVTGNNAENRLIAHSNISPIEEPMININSENLVSNNYLLNQAKGTFADGTEKIDLSQMELTEAVPVHNINKRQSISNFTGKSSDILRGASQKHAIIDRENIPPSQGLNESNLLDVTELNFAEAEIGTYNFNTESNPKININSQVNPSKPSDMRLINEGDISNMEFTEGLPMSVLNRAGKTEQKIIENNEMKKNPAFGASVVDNILGNSSCMEFTSALPQLKQSDTNVKNTDSKVKDEVPTRPNIFNSMVITEIDQGGCGGNLKENRNEVYNINKITVQPTFNMEQTISKDISLMEFTEALPGRNIQAGLARQLNCGNNSKTVKNDVFSRNYNLQTSNMEFTEVLPMFKSKLAIINSKGVHEDISPSHDILLDKDIIPEKNLNDSCSMDVTDVENVPNHEPFKNLKESIEISNKNQVNIISSDFADIPKLEIDEKLDHDYKINTQNLPFLSGSQNNIAKERKTSYELQSGFSQLEFTEAVPVRNEFFTEKIAQDVFISENKEQNIMLPRENDLLATSNMEFTEFVQKPDSQQFNFPFENEDKGRKKEGDKSLNKVTSPVTKENVDKLSSENLIGTKNIEHATVEKIDEIYVQDSYNKQLSNDLVVQENKEIDKSQMKFSPNSEQGRSKTFTLPSRPHENMFTVANQLLNSSVDTTQMDFTEAVQPQIHLNEKILGGLVDLETVENKIPDASQMEFTEAITRQKYQRELYQDIKDTEVDNFADEKSKSRSKELLQPNVETTLDYLPLPQSDKQENISSYEKESQIKNSINEDVKIAEQNQKMKKACFESYSQSKSSEEGVILNSLPGIFQNVNALGIKLQRPLQKSVEISNTDKINEDSVTIKISDKDNSQELNTYKNESASTDQNLKDVTPMFVVLPSTPSIEKKESKVNSLRKIFENDSKSDYYNTDFNTPKSKQVLAVRSTEDNSCESSNKYVGNSTSASDVKMLAVDHVSHKKNLVHFNTPPVRIIKRRKTLGPLNPEESVQLLQSSTSDLAVPLQDVSNMQNASQRRGIFEEDKKSAYDPEKGNEEWNRLVKNDAFMKQRSFEFISPCKWKYKFRWPMELVLEIPDIEVSENSRRKNISLVSNINESDHISVFIDNRMKKNMSVILSEKWLNSHCKTIKDLLFTINFVEEEYNKLEPLINSMRYFYREFPYDFSSDRIIFKIVNLRKEFCFEVKIDVSYGQVKGKNIDVINHVGQISKTKVQQLFDQLQPNTERFYLFWQKLMEIN